VGQWYNLTLSSKIRTHTVTMNNGTVLLSVTDSGAFQTWGAFGMYVGALSRAMFDDFTLDR